jgi:hypothetical protein
MDRYLVPWKVTREFATPVEGHGQLSTAGIWGPVAAPVVVVSVVVTVEATGPCDTAVGRPKAMSDATVGPGAPADTKAGTATTVLDTPAEVTMTWRMP